MAGNIRGIVAGAQLQKFVSIGLTTRVREIIEQGPPDTLPAQVEKYFADKEVETLAVAKESIRRLGWSLPSQ